MRQFSDAQQRLLNMTCVLLSQMLNTYSSVMWCSVGEYACMSCNERAGECVCACSYPTHDQHREDHRGTAGEGAGKNVDIHLSCTRNRSSRSRRSAMTTLTSEYWRCALVLLGSLWRECINQCWSCTNILRSGNSLYHDVPAEGGGATGNCCKTRADNEAKLSACEEFLMRHGPAAAHYMMHDVCTHTFLILPLALRDGLSHH